ncbi:glycosyl transferase [Pedobacter panaciterrae]|uniref:glycosyl transferase n=1 Tax=Pedobacter panaciterrae TaxID=363849 RepID=UPI00155DAB7F|nr:glycosyl transferase [Pedobacter panaciterrae]NQX56818.1 glycosyl transferase [Pedobacter panaciterrae]
MEDKIVVFIINLTKRTDRREHIINEFNTRKGFDFVLINAIEHESGAFGLWTTIKTIIKRQMNQTEDYIIVCEDDHTFTNSFNMAFLNDSIKKAKEKNADVLLGGVSWFSDVIQVSPGLFWVDKFSGLQFTVIFRKFFKSILNANFSKGDAADYKISDLTSNTFVTFPFISKQKEFGYSDVTAGNNSAGKVSRLFKNSSLKLKHLNKVNDFYNL